jgi:ribosomal-protein-alanine N-acetyltransferase
MARKICVYIRWMIRRDFPEVLGIEAASFAAPWSEEDFVRVLRGRGAIGQVAECENRVVGYMVYELSKTKMRLLNLAVAVDARRQGVGGLLIGKLVGKLSAHGRRRIVVEVGEKNLDGQLFFAACGFRAVCVARRFYEDAQDAYVMQYAFRDGRLPPDLASDRRKRLAAAGLRGAEESGERKAESGEPATDPKDADV